jgi:sulfur carrier protein
MARMLVKLNGALRELPEGESVAALLERLGVRAPRVAVIVNDAVVERSRYPGHLLGPGDAVEIVPVMGGA